jgi:myo-inositol-hexaphosphate 3-phosphohydrolase
MRIFVTAALLVFAVEANDVGPTPVMVPAARETAPVEVVPAAGQEGKIDAADDPAIIVGATPADTRIIGTNKKGGLYVYDLDGKVTQSAPGGLPNNVDMREAFPWAEGPAPIVATSDRIDNTIAIYRFDPKTKHSTPKHASAFRPVSSKSTASPWAVLATTSSSSPPPRTATSPNGR